MLYILFGIVILAAITAVEAKRLTSAVIAFGIMGFGVCLTYVIEGSIDIAFIQLAAEIALLVVLVKATRDMAEPESFRWYEILAAVFFIVFFAIFAYYAAIGLPVSGKQVKERIDLYNMIGVLFAVLSGVIGAFAVLRPQGKQGEDDRC